MNSRWRERGRDDGKTRREWENLRREARPMRGKDRKGDVLKKPESESFLCRSRQGRARDSRIPQLPLLSPPLLSARLANDGGSLHLRLPNLHREEDLERRLAPFQKQLKMRVCFVMPREEEARERRDNG